MLDMRAYAATSEELRRLLNDIAVRHPDCDQITFLCIGSDCSTGDAYGPLVGSELAARGFPHIIGTLDTPCDARSVAAAAAAAREREAAGAITIAIDACLGKPEAVGSMLAASGPLEPGEALNRGLPPLGHYHIKGIVNRFGPKAYWMLQTTSLRLVMKMAAETASAIGQAWPASAGSDRE
ncbi:spore protease YyaC [Paenibacillus sp. J5C_2022]|uniref:spore protease YyaC n=1 Tax=Paenibacillus sp. J5C2022 TaxID=2977129 RepID=UPI0021D0C7BD|nr:spore protease YyaC [Paenibacillus sp. J5C2022]MCU6711819.1 spore protease YyaC [Paenibacillus sp. J5C2022]